MLGNEEPQELQAEDWHDQSGFCVEEKSVEVETLVWARGAMAAELG